LITAFKLSKLNIDNRLSNVQNIILRFEYVIQSFVGFAVGIPYLRSQQLQALKTWKNLAKARAIFTVYA
jgi:ABC-type Fe3+ transport system substrate-binding protein